MKTQRSPSSLALVAAAAALSSASASEVPCPSSDECRLRGLDLGLSSFHDGDYPDKGCFSKGGMAFWSPGTLEEMAEEELQGSRERIWCLGVEGAEFEEGNVEDEGGTETETEGGETETETAETETETETGEEEGGTPCLTASECEAASLPLYERFSEGPYPTKGCFAKSGHAYFSPGTAEEMSAGGLSGVKERIWCDPVDETVEGGDADGTVATGGVEAGGACSLADPCANPERFHCDFPQGTCGADGVSGVCTEFSAEEFSCLGVWTPVCGCDGIVYGNSCESSAWGGTSVARDLDPNDEGVLPRAPCDVQGPPAEDPVKPGKPAPPPTTVSPVAQPVETPVTNLTDASFETPVADPSPAPTKKPTPGPTLSPVVRPTTEEPTDGPSGSPIASPTAGPTKGPTPSPSESPVASPTEAPVLGPSVGPVVNGTDVVDVNGTDAVVAEGNSTDVTDANGTEANLTGWVPLPSPTPLTPEEKFPCTTREACDAKRLQMGISGFKTGEGYPSRGCYYKNDKAFFSPGTPEQMSKEKLPGIQIRIWCDPPSPTGSPVGAEEEEGTSEGNATDGAAADPTRRPTGKPTSVEIRDPPGPSTSPSAQPTKGPSSEEEEGGGGGLVQVVAGPKEVVGASASSRPVWVALVTAAAAAASFMLC